MTSDGGFVVIKGDISGGLGGIVVHLSVKERAHIDESEGAVRGEGEIGGESEGFLDWFETPDTRLGVDVDRLPGFE